MTADPQGRGAHSYQLGAGGVHVPGGFADGLDLVAIPAKLVGILVERPGGESLIYDRIEVYDLPFALGGSPGSAVPVLAINATREMTRTTTGSVETRSSRWVPLGIELRKGLVVKFEPDVTKPALVTVLYYPR